MEREFIWQMFTEHLPMPGTVTDPGDSEENKKSPAYIELTF